MTFSRAKPMATSITTLPLMFVPFPSSKKQRNTKNYKLKSKTHTHFMCVCFKPVSVKLARYR